MIHPTIRRITPSDREEFLALSREFYASEAVAHPIPEAHRIACFEELMRSDVYTECLLFEQDGTVAGYALLCKTYSQEAGGTVLWIDELYVRPTHRGQGIGKAFFAWLLENRAPHIARLRLEIEPDNQKAAKLYASFGFAPLPYTQMVREFGICPPNGISAKPV